jgi:hypothetical protein
MVVEAAKMMTIGIGAARTAKNFGKSHKLSDLEVDNLCRSAPCHLEQGAPKTGMAASCGHGNYFGASAAFTALHPSYYLSALIRSPYRRPHGMHLQPLHEPERQHWVLSCTKYDRAIDRDGPTQQVLLDSSRPEEYVDVSRSIVLAFRALAFGSSDRGTCTFSLPPCPQQTGGVACGLFVAANYYFIMTGEMDPFADPTEANAPCTFKYDVALLYTWYMTLLRQGRWSRNPRIGSGYACHTMVGPPHRRVPPQQTSVPVVKTHVSTVSPSATTVHPRRVSSRPTKGKRRGNTN